MTTWTFGWGMIRNSLFLNPFGGTVCIFKFWANPCSTFLFSLWNRRVCARPQLLIYLYLYIYRDRERHVFVFTLFVIMTPCLIPKGEKFWWWHTSQIRKVSKLTNILESSLVFSFAIVSPARSFRAVRCSATVCYSAWWSRNRRARLAGEATQGAELRGLTNHFVGFNMFQPTKHAICTQNW